MESAVSFAVIILQPEICGSGGLIVGPAGERLIRRLLTQLWCGESCRQFQRSGRISFRYTGDPKLIPCSCFSKAASRGTPPRGFDLHHAATSAAPCCFRAWNSRCIPSISAIAASALFEPRHE